jgi:hypothetical protein
MRFAARSGGFSHSYPQAAQADGARAPQHSFRLLAEVNVPKMNEVSMSRAFGASMAIQQPSPYRVVAREWLSLVERRKAHLVELFETGRWRHYYTEAELLGELRSANLAHDRFANVAGLLP